MRSVTPLPNALSGTKIQRLIEIDEALIPYVNGALVWLCDKEPFKETGTLTVDDAKLLFSDMLQTYFGDMYMPTPVGGTMVWHTATPPANWLSCTGGVAFVAEWPELFALWGYKYGGSGTQFALPDMRDVSPMGYGGGLIGLDAYSGAATVILATNQIPVHNHRERVSTGVSANIFTTAGGGNSYVASGGATVGTAPINTGDTGGGLSHNNLSPVIGVHFIVFAGKRVP